MMPETLSALRDLIAETDELQKAAGGSVTARALDWLLPQSAVAARKQVSAAATPIEQWNLFRQIASDIVPVRRAELAAGHLALERQRFAFDEAHAKALTEKEFWKWTRNAGPSKLPWLARKRRQMICPQAAPAPPFLQRPHGRLWSHPVKPSHTKSNLPHHPRSLPLHAIRTGVARVLPSPPWEHGPARVPHSCGLRNRCGETHFCQTNPNIRAQELHYSCLFLKLLMSLLIITQSLAKSEFLRDAILTSPGLNPMQPRKTIRREPPPFSHSSLIKPNQARGFPSREIIGYQLTTTSDLPPSWCFLATSVQLRQTLSYV